MPVLIPTKTIPQLTAYGVPLAGSEMLEISATGVSRRITARDFVLPIDSVVTAVDQTSVLPGSRYLASGIGIAFTGGGAGQALTINATGAVAGPANPTASVGLIAVNGAAVTYMRSDAAPPLSQAVVPTWTGRHTFGLAGDTAILPSVQLSSILPQINLIETDGAVDNRTWVNYAQGENLFFGVVNDLGSAGNSWALVSRTGIVIDAIDLFSTALTWNGSPLLSVATAFANPTASLGLAAINGVATTAMRSDAAPALSQAIAPTWTAQHIFSLSGATNAAILVSSAQPQVDWNETDAAANNRRWRWEAQGEQLLGRTVNDANSAVVTWIAVDRTLNVVDTIALTSTALTWNGNPLLSTATAFANPTGTVGLATVNGVATTAMRSDAAPPLSQAIVPTWTGVHTFSNTGGAILLSSVSPTQRWNETDAAADNRLWGIGANSEQLLFQVVNDAVSVANNFMTVDRTGTTVDNVAFPSQVNLTQALSTLIYPLFITSTTPAIGLNETDAAANNRLWDWAVAAEQLLGRIRLDDGSVSTSWIVVDRTGTTVDTVNFPNGTLQYAGAEVGLRNSVRRDFSTSDNTVAADNGKILRFTGAGGQTFTLDSDIPSGGGLRLLNNGSAALTVAASTLEWFTGAAVTAGSRTLAVGGWMFIYSNGAGSFFVWGAGIT